MTFARSAKMTRPVVEIWSDMTVAELAACVKKETGMFYSNIADSEIELKSAFLTRTILTAEILW